MIKLLNRKRFEFSSKTILILVLVFIFAATGTQAFAFPTAKDGIGFNDKGVPIAFFNGLQETVVLPVTFWDQREDKVVNSATYQNEFNNKKAALEKAFEDQKATAIKNATTTESAIIAETETALKTATAAKTEADNALDAAKAVIADNPAKIASLDSDIDGYDKKITELTASIKELESALAALPAADADTDNEETIAAKEAAIAAATTELSTANEALATANQELDAAKQSQSDLQTALDDAKDNIADLTAAAEKAAAEYGTADSAATDAKADFEAAKEQYLSSAAFAEFEAAKAAELKTKIDTLKTDYIWKDNGEGSEKTVVAPATFTGPLFTNNTGRQFDWSTTGGSPYGLATGLVENKLGADGNPVAKGGSLISGQYVKGGAEGTAFYRWYHKAYQHGKDDYAFTSNPTDGAQVSSGDIQGNLVFKRVPNTNTYKFENTSFFPLDSTKPNNSNMAVVDGKSTVVPYVSGGDYNSSFSAGDITSGGHNFHFTMKLVNEFTYSTGEQQTFDFSGDDDVWVFIDDTLVLDIGGVHEKTNGSFRIDPNGNVYNGSNNKIAIDGAGTAGGALLNGTQHKWSIFLAERCVTASNCVITTSLVNPQAEVEKSVADTRFDPKTNTSEVDFLIHVRNKEEGMSLLLTKLADFMNFGINFDSTQGGFVNFDGSTDTEIGKLLYSTDGKTWSDSNFVTTTVPASGDGAFVLSNPKMLAPGGSVWFKYTYKTNQSNLNNKLALHNAVSTYLLPYSADGSTPLIGQPAVCASAATELKLIDLNIEKTVADLDPAVITDVTANGGQALKALLSGAEKEVDLTYGHKAAYKIEVDNRGIYAAGSGAETKRPVTLDDFFSPVDGELGGTLYKEGTNGLEKVENITGVDVAYVPGRGSVSAEYTGPVTYYFVTDAITKPGAYKNTGQIYAQDIFDGKKESTAVATLVDSTVRVKYYKDRVAKDDDHYLGEYTIVDGVDGTGAEVFYAKGQPQSDVNPIHLSYEKAAAYAAAQGKTIAEPEGYLLDDGEIDPEYSLVTVGTGDYGYEVSVVFTRNPYLILTAGTDSKIYDASPLTNDTFTISGSQQIKPSADGTGFEYYGQTYSVSAPMTAGSTITDVTPNGVGNVIDVNELKITDSANTNVIASINEKSQTGESEVSDEIVRFRVITVGGNLAIDPVAITVKPVDEIKDYDGTALVATKYEILEGAFVGADSFIDDEVIYGGSQTKVGKSESIIQDISITTAGIQEDYVIVTEPGNLEVLPVTPPVTTPNPPPIEDNPIVQIFETVINSVITPLTTPLAGGNAGTAGNPIPINSTQVPLGGGAAWALLNLILTIATVLMSLALIITYFTKRNEKTEWSEEDAAALDAYDNYVIEQLEDEEEEKKLKKHGILRIFSIIAAIVAVVVFILTENLLNPMVFTDRYTIWMAVIAIVQLFVTYFSKKKIADDEEEELDLEDILYQSAE